MGKGFILITLTQAGVALAVKASAYNFFINNYKKRLAFLANLFYLEKLFL